MSCCCHRAEDRAVPVRLFLCLVAVIGVLGLARKGLIESEPGPVIESMLGFLVFLVVLEADVIKIHLS